MYGWIFTLSFAEDLAALEVADINKIGLLDWVIICLITAGAVYIMNVVGTKLAYKYPLEKVE